MKWKLLCNDFPSPSGTDGAPWFSWRLESPTVPDHWRVRVFDASHKILWDAQTDRPMGEYLIYNGQLLASMTRYFWQVQTDTDGSIQKSPVSSFLTGILHDEDWHNAVWIEAEPNVSSPLFKRSFSLSAEQAQHGVICICGLGLYELYCNGKKVSADRMTPARTDYAPVQRRNLQYPFSGETRKSALYQTYDLRGLLHAGENTICAWLGNGFYRQTARTVEGEFDYGAPALLCCIRCAGKTIVSDSSWQTAPSPLLHDDPFTGEIFDARLFPDEKTIWESVCCAAPKKTELRPQLCPPDGVWQHIHPQALAGGIYDAGINLTGVVQVVCRGARGARVHLYFAEQLQHSELDFTSTCGYGEADKNQRQHDLYILRGIEDEQYCPRFVCHGFRYVKIIAEDAQILDVTILRTGMQLLPAASLETSMPELDALFHACADALRGNLSCGVLSDCPHRERLGYTGDGQLSADALMTLFDAHAFCRKWIQDILDAQDEKTGFVPHTAPFCGGGGGPAWGSAVAVIPWLNYLHYGDTNNLREALPAIEHWLDYLAGHADERGLICREEAGSWCLGDWVFPSDRPWSEPQLEQPLKPEFVNTCYYARCLQLYRNICRVLDLPLAGRYEQTLALTIRNVNHAFFHNGSYLDGVQGADAFALMAGVVPETQLDAVRCHLISYYESRDCVPDTGMFGTAHVLEELSRAGRRDLAWRIICRKEYPGLLYLLTQRGYTAMGETWEGSGSQSHIAFTFTASWLMRWLAGIRVDESPENKRVVVIDPYFPEELRTFRARAHTPSGEIEVLWERQGDLVRFALCAPPCANIKTVFSYVPVSIRRNADNTITSIYEMRVTK